MSDQEPSVEVVRPSIEISVVMKQTWGAGDGKGVMHMTLSDCSMNVTDPETGNQIGRIAACLGGGVEVHVRDDVYFLAYQDLYRAVLRARAKLTS